MKKGPKVVVDTNVIVSGILTENSYPSKIINAWISGDHFHPVICKSLQNEINEVFKRPNIAKRIPKSQKELKLILGVLFNKAEKVTPIKIEESLFSDSKDHFILELAVSAGANIIVSGDIGILEHLSYREIEFMNPESFCRRIGL
jgi:uncharacterized protein